VPLAPLAAPSSPACSARPSAAGRAHGHHPGRAGRLHRSALVLLSEVLAARASTPPSTSGWCIGGLKMEVGFLVDGLTAMMMVVVTFVSLMVHIYTIGYMEDDPGYQRFFSYISLFTFSMLMLVMSNNFLQLFFGWEAVGLVSLPADRLLVQEADGDLRQHEGLPGQPGRRLRLHPGHRPDAGLRRHAELRRVRQGARAGQADLFPGTDWMLITVACICLFIGAMGKSAQFPLHVWLPDSMEGPTPISALIHAATMVTAGIFMVARMSPLFELSDTALNFVLVIGAITALFMGFLGIIQNDIKRVVAYSTLSQLGYMTVALGVSAYSGGGVPPDDARLLQGAAVPGAGSVIIGMHHDQDIRNMGGLRKYMPITWITSLLGSWR
jgi:NADH-quinone oxidoreductase subunit L